MSDLKRALFSAAWFGGLFLVTLPLQAQEVYRYTQTNSAESDLETRMEWALEEAESRNLTGFWSVYSVRRTMQEGSTIGNWSSSSLNMPPVGQVLTGITMPERIDPRQSFDGAAQKGKMESKELAVLVRFSGERPTVTNVDISDLTLSFDFENLPVFWLGSSSDGQSIGLLEKTFQLQDEDDLREDVVSIIGMHEDLALVEPFLVNAAGQSFPDDVRQNAVFWLSRIESSANVERLFQLAQEDPSDDVRESAVFALNRMVMIQAQENLITLAREGRHEGVRENARFWLGQKASKKLVQEDIPETDETRLQKQAIIALMQMGDDESLPALIDLAQTHRNPAVRKQAIFWLGQSEDKRALDAIVSILKKS